MIEAPDIIEGSPLWFSDAVLGQKTYPWQDWVLCKIEDPRGRRKISVVAPNGSGKSERVIATSALWVPFAHTRGTTVITTADGKQLDNQIWPAITKHRAKFPDWKFLDRRVDTPTGGRIIAFTTDEPGRAEGWHKEMDSGLLDGPLLIICDEAKSIPEPIFDAIKLRCNFTWLLLISSAGLRQGTFYESQSDPSYVTRRVTHEDCPHLDPERIADLLALGRDHPVVASTLFSEFMSQDDANAFFLTLEQFDQCRQNPTKIKRGDRVAFCDFAGGGDENVLAWRDGNKVEIAAAWTERNTMAAVGRFIIEFKRLGLKQEEIYADEGGLGKPMVDKLHEAGWHINRVNNGAKAYDDRFANRGAEIWYTGCQQIAKPEVILPDDKALKQQLCSRKMVTKSNGQIGCESKEDMKKRGMKSPDRADAVLGCLCHRSMEPIIYHDPLEKRGNLVWDAGAQEVRETEERGVMAGFDAGY